MAYRGVIHEPEDPEEMLTLLKNAAQFRAEKTLKQLTEMGVPCRAVLDCLRQGKIQHMESEEK